MPNFNEHLQALRIEAGLTQLELSERTGVNAGMIAHMEAGRRVPSFGTVEKLLLYFSAQELFGYLDSENCRK